MKTQLFLPAYYILEEIGKEFTQSGIMALRNKNPGLINKPGFCFRKSKN